MPIGKITNGEVWRTRLKRLNLSFNSTKSQFKWNAEYEELKNFISCKFQQGQTNIIAENDNGTCKVLKFEKITFNFYQRTKTLQTQGAAKNEYEEKLKEIIDQESDKIHVVDESTRRGRSSQKTKIKIRHAMLNLHQMNHPTVKTKNMMN